MSEQTARLELPYIMAAQAQKHVTHNEALREIDSLLFLTFPERESAAPPSELANGQSFFTGLQASGAWQGNGGKIATWVDDAWQFQVPVVGMVAYVISQKLLIGFDGTKWAELGNVPDELELDKLAIGTSVSQTNVLAVKGNAADFSALPTGAGGSGDMRISLNRERGGDAASVIFKTNYVGTAEFGLTGNNDFALKVSDDGLAWRDAIVVDPATGYVRLPNGGTREQLTAPRTYFVSPSGSNSNSGLSAQQPFASVQHAVNAALALDALGHQVTIQLANGTYLECVKVSRPMFDGGMLAFRGNSAFPDLVLIDGGVGPALKVDGTGAVALVDGVKMQGVIGLWVRYGALVYVRGKTAYGTCGARHISADNGGYVEIIGQTFIMGNANEHLYAEAGGHILMTQSTVTLEQTPHFASTFALASATGITSIYGNTYVGSATGVRYVSKLNGTILVNNAGVQVLPGSVAGQTQSGGVYA